ncbi:MAG: hypothetical protein M1812_003234 [Candelaria pacifica]|nr:MAG: hypothetical protein M1812_003234 [Candelaria pacifica]
MSRPPAVVIVARHGARLDAADKQWHLTSPTPYDPPLTYGGWTQSRALGARIASLLQARESSLHDHDRKDITSSTTSDAGGSGAQEPKPQKSGRPRRRKHKVIIHTSPFLRCVQTSVAISAGMAQLHSSSDSSSHSTSRSTHPHSGSPHLHAVDSIKSSTLSAIPEPEEDLTHTTHKKHRRARKYRKATVRVDAFLGEWLSPDYFDLITPPPNSVMMVASAKADLLRRAEYVDPPHETINGKTIQGNFPGGWSSTWGGTPSRTDGPDDGPLSSMSSLGHVLPPKDRSSSHSGVGSSKASRTGISKIATNAKEHGGYTPPTPTYAISPSDPIPPGYVAHARDGCVEVDYQWDSMREPQGWGDGGEYGEEWSAMHKRFRKGLQSMISWYRSHGSAKPAEKAQIAVPEVCDEDEDDEPNDDTVLILVTHGAGCNALIGALTNQPVLLDVGMASLTMAVRKGILNGVNPSSPEYSQPTFSPRRKSSIDIGVSEDYDVKLIASTEHLRAGSTPNGIPQLQSQNPKISTPQISTYRHRYGPTTLIGGPVDSGFTLGEPAARSMTTAGYGGLHRSSSAASSTPRSFPTTTRKGSLGLWGGSPTLSTSEEDIGSGDDMVLNFGDGARDSKEIPARAESCTVDVDQEIARNNITPLWGADYKGTTNSQRGLWGTAPLGIANERERGPKRRWTVNEKHSG